MLVAFVMCIQIFCSQLHVKPLYVGQEQGDRRSESLTVVCEGGGEGKVHGQVLREKGRH